MFFKVCMKWELPTVCFTEKISLCGWCSLSSYKQWSYQCAPRWAGFSVTVLAGWYTELRAGCHCTAVLPSPRSSDTHLHQHGCPLKAKWHPLNPSLPWAVLNKKQRENIHYHKCEGFFFFPTGFMTLVLQSLLCPLAASLTGERRSMALYFK